MRSKIALLLAFILSISMVPMNVYAATEAYLSDPATVIAEKSVLVEDNITGTIKEVIPGGEYKYIKDGTDLVLELRSNLNAGDTFELQLENAKWFFRGNLPSTSFSTSATTNFSTLMQNNGMPTVPANWSTISTENWAPPTLVVSPQLPVDQSTYNIEDGVWGYNTSVQNNGSLATQGTYYRLGSITPETNQEIPYKLEISADDTKATVTILKDINNNTSYNADDKIRIPLVCRATSTNQFVTVQIIQGNTTSISSAILAFGIAGGALTHTHINDYNNIYYTSPIPIDKLTVKESRIHGLTKPIGEDDGFYITAPEGFEFADPTVNTKVGVDRDLTWTGNYSYGYGIPGVDYTISWKNAGTPLEDKSTIQVTIKNLEPSSDISGAIFIEDLQLIAKSNAPSGDILMEITNMDNDTNLHEMVTEQFFTAGEYVNNANNKNIKMTASPTNAGNPIATSNSAIVASATSGSAINISANPKSNYAFEYWTVIPTNVTLASPYSANTSFAMPNQDVEITAHYKYIGNSGNNNNNSDGNQDESDSDENYSTIYATSKSDAETNATPTKPEPKPIANNDLELRQPLMNGDTDGNFRPNNNLTRAEVAQVIYNSLYDGSILPQTTFDDVSDDEWYNTAINFAYANGYMVGYTDGNFNPNAPITRAEVLVVFNNIYGYEPRTDQHDMYTDIADHWANEQINSTAYYMGLEGYPDGSFKPDDNITRGDFAIMLSKATDRVEYSPENEFYDVSETDYYYEYVMAVTNECK